MPAPTLKDVSGIPTRRAVLLDLAAGVGLSGPALMLLYSVDRRPTWMTISVALLLTAAVSVWVMWRRSGQSSRIGAVVFAVIATATMALGDGSLYYGAIWTACLVLGVTFSSGLVVWGYAAVLVSLVIVLHVSAGSRIDVLVDEVIASMFFAGIAAAVSAILRDSLRVGSALGDAIARLDAVNGELRRRLDTDRDLVLARERERTAHELHDSLGHRLTAIGLSLDYALRVDDTAAARDELARARRLVSDSLDAMRRLVRAMHPVELATLRHTDAFRAVADAFRGTGIDIRVSVDGDDAALSHEHALLLLRFAQEGLTNVVRHSSATSVDLRVTVGETAGTGPPTDQVSAVMEDRGDASPAASFEEGFGLRSLRTRAEGLGGTLGATCLPTGFRLTLALPAAPAVGGTPRTPDELPRVTSASSNGAA